MFLSVFERFRYYVPRAYTLVHEMTAVGDRGPGTYVLLFHFCRVSPVCYATYTVSSPFFPYFLNTTLIISEPV